MPRTITLQYATNPDSRARLAPEPGEWSPAEAAQVLHMIVILSEDGLDGLDLTHRDITSLIRLRDALLTGTLGASETRDDEVESAYREGYADGYALRRDATGDCDE